MPKLSILLPTYNGERFLVEQVESILAQSDGDFELLAIDDGSTDATVQTLHALAAGDRRMSVVPSTGNCGQNARIAELLGRARSDYIAIADQDDRWALDRNERLFAALGGGAMAFGRSELIDGDGGRVGKSLLEFFHAEFRPDYRLRALLAPLFSAHATITRADRVNIESLYHPMPFDWLMALEALFADGLAYDDGAIVFHRIHGGNQMNNVGLDRDRTRLTRSDVRHMTAYQMPDRARMWLVFDYLGRSRLLAQDLRRTFGRLSVDCRSNWFSEWRPLSGRQPALRRTILDALLPLAASEADRAGFEERIDALTNPFGSPPVLREIRRRYRSWRGG